MDNEGGWKSASSSCELRSNEDNEACDRENGVEEHVNGALNRPRDLLYMRGL